MAGVGSVALSAEATQLMNRIHTDWLRVPMVSLALVGALVNMAALLRVWRLQGCLASQWFSSPFNSDAWNWPKCSR
ncbi:MAG: hypothetical protein WBW84_20030 [Acidobacteriaceae bacterium]